MNGQPSVKILENRHNISIMMYVLYNEGCMKSDIYRDVSTNPRIPDKLNSLINAGLLSMTVDKFRSNATTITLTDKGREVAEHLSCIDELILG